MQFLYSPLTWGFVLIGVPILVHLINLLRHRRQRWAAMDFLLESYRRNRRWVMLKQWLLLLARMLAMAILVMLLAKWVSSAQWLSWFGGKTTHHFILLDDSYSMASRQESSETAYSHALRALTNLLQQIANQPGDHQVTLIRWSRAFLAMQQFALSGQTEETDSSAQLARMDVAADLLAQTIGNDPARLIERLQATEPTGLQLFPETTLELIQPALVNQTGEFPIVYMLTDLRQNQFGQPDRLKEQTQRLSQLNVPLHLIDCSDGESQNLSIVSLEPEQEVWAAGVPLLVRLALRNPSGHTVKNIVAKVRMILYPEGQVTASTEQEYSGAIVELPPVVIEAIDPGQTVARQVQVVFPTAGGHVIEASIPDDVLPVDNTRWCTINIRQSQQVLLVDGDVRQANAFYLESVINPGQQLQTGMTVQKVDAAFLRDVSAEELAQFDVIALLDVPRLDPQAIDKLTIYAQQGGGVFIVCGRNTNLNFANEQLYRGGEGLLPVSLQEIIEMPDNPLGVQPQVTASDHPILAPLQKLSTSPFFATRIRKYLATTIASGSTDLQIVATGPDNRPLIVDKSLGDGRVVTMLTGLTTDWSNWAQDPTFVVVSLRTLGYLSSFRRPDTERPVGTAVQMIVTNRSVLPQGDILLPTGSSRRIRLQRQVESAEHENVARLTLSADLQSSAQDRALIDGMLRSGLIECWMTTSEGAALVQTVSHNVAAEEGDLQRVSHQELQRQFSSLDLHIRSASSLSSGLSSTESSQSTLMTVLLLLLLLGEQILAYSASYHGQSVSISQGSVQRDGGKR